MLGRVEDNKNYNLLRNRMMLTIERKSVNVLAVFALCLAQSPALLRI